MDEEDSETSVSGGHRTQEEGVQPPFAAFTVTNSDPSRQNPLGLRG